MNLLLPLKTRRDFLRTTGAVAACFTSAGAFAEALTRTPSGTEGPYYPNHLPLDTDIDAVIVDLKLDQPVDPTTLNGEELVQEVQPGHHYQQL